jgi:hypothetical protein
MPSRQPVITIMKRRLVIVLLGAALAEIAAVAAVLYTPSPGINVTVLNRGPETMTEVKVQVKGHEYSVGQLAPGSSATVRMLSSAPSGIANYFRNTDDILQRLEAGVSLQHGDRRTVTSRPSGTNG